MISKEYYQKLETGEDLVDTIINGCEGVNCSDCPLQTVFTNKADVLCSLMHCREIRE